MTEILFENMGNLNMIDRSFFTDNEGNTNYRRLNGSKLSPNSEVIRDRVTPHTFTHVMEILNQHDVNAIIVRAHKRQLVIVTKEQSTGRVLSHNYSYSPHLKLSHFAEKYCNPDRKYSGNGVSTSSEASLKTGISRTVRAFYENYLVNELGEEGAKAVKKDWDILIVKSDVAGTTDLRNQRYTNKQNMVYTPQDKHEYSEYIDKLRKAFKARANEYIRSHMRDNMTKEEVVEMLKQNFHRQKIKYQGEIYSYENIYSSDFQSSERNYVKYVRLRPDGSRSYSQYLYVHFVFNRDMTIEITDVEVR